MSENIFGIITRFGEDDFSYWEGFSLSEEEEKQIMAILERKGWVYDHFFGEAEDPEDYIVVGNIFDNPQLKKKYGKDWEEEHK